VIWSVQTEEIDYDAMQRMPNPDCLQACRYVLEKEVW